MSIDYRDLLPAISTTYGTTASDMHEIQQKLWSTIQYFPPESHFNSLPAASPSIYRWPIVLDQRYEDNSYTSMPTLDLSIDNLLKNTELLRQLAERLYQKQADEAEKVLLTEVAKAQEMPTPRRVTPGRKISRL